jgi:hypothetical protein
MTTKTDFTTEEWDALLAGPLAASMYIIVASPSVFGSIKEITAMSKELANAVARPDNTELMRFMLADYKEKDTVKRVMPEIKGKPEEVKATLTDTIQKAVSLLNEKATPEESSQIRTWMMDLSVKTAEAAKEGGFLGIHAVRVSDAEKRALADLAGILDVPVPDIAADVAAAPTEVEPAGDAPAEDANTDEAPADEDAPAA